MTSTDRLVAGVIGALLAPTARLVNEMKAALGVVIVCVALATTMEVMIATTVAKRMTAGRENFCIRILIAFILCGFLSGLGSRVRRCPSEDPSRTNALQGAEDSLKRRVTRSDAFLANQTSLCQASLFLALTKS
jgi:hypothetical protein